MLFVGPPPQLRFAPEKLWTSVEAMREFSRRAIADVEVLDSAVSFAG